MTNDPSIADLYDGDPTPEHRPGFWDRIENELAADTANTTVIDIHQLTPITGSVTEERRSRWPLIMAAAAIVAVIGIGGAFAALRGGNDGATSVAARGAERSPLLHPMVAMYGQRTDLADTTLFTVERVLTGWQPKKDYWPIATLDSFDGTLWRTEIAAKPMPFTVPSPDGRLGLDNFTVFGDAWSTLPQTTGAVGVFSDASLSIGDEGELLVDRDAVDGSSPLTYTVQYDPAYVAYESEAVAIGQHLSLPAEFPASVRDLAAELTGDVEDSELAKAIALQDFFRDNFVHSVGPPDLPSNEGMVGFLEERSGSSEMFAGTFAAMMRAIGVPSRVVVGFTPGSTDPENPGLFTVTGSHAHAWPEVLISSEGPAQWVRFEPTPGSGVPIETIRPVANRDHWHAIYGVYDCTTKSYLPPFQSEVDEFGIHSHQDGLIHIHPWFDSSAGENAQLGLFFETMGIEVTESGITLENGDVLAAGVTCDGQPATVHVRKWQFDFQAANSAAQIITGDPNVVRFENDREAYIIALAPIEADIPPLPADRFQTMNEATGPMDFDDVTDVVVTQQDLDDWIDQMTRSMGGTTFSDDELACAQSELVDRPKRDILLMYMDACLGQDRAFIVLVASTLGDYPNFVMTEEMQTCALERKAEAGLQLAPPYVSDELMDFVLSVPVLCAMGP